MTAAEPYNATITRTYESKLHHPASHFTTLEGRQLDGVDSFGRERHPHGNRFQKSETRIASRLHPDQAARAPANLFVIELASLWPPINGEILSCFALSLYQRSAIEQGKNPGGCLTASANPDESPRSASILGRQDRCSWAVINCSITATSFSAMLCTRVFLYIKRIMPALSARKNLRALEPDSGALLLLGNSDHQVEDCRNGVRVLLVSNVPRPE